MKVTVVGCPCGTPIPHRKFQSEDGRQTEGFFSIAQGRSFLRKLQKAGDLNPAEARAAQAELAVCGLPAETEHSEQELLILAADQIAAGVSSKEFERMISKSVEDGELSEKSAKRLRGYFKNHEATFRAANEAVKIDIAVEVLSHASPEQREKAIQDGVAIHAITEEFAGKIRERIKDLPYEPNLSVEALRTLLGSRRGAAQKN